jgi:hypothetical protein
MTVSDLFGSILINFYSKSTTRLDLTQSTYVSTGLPFVNTTAIVTNDIEENSSALPEEYPDAGVIIPTTNQREIFQKLPGGIENAESRSLKPIKIVQSTCSCHIVLNDLSL